MGGANGVGVTNRVEGGQPRGGMANRVGVATDGHLHREGEPRPLHSLCFTPNDTRAEKRPADLQVHEPFNHTNQAMPQHRWPETVQGQIAT